MVLGGRGQRRGGRRREGAGSVALGRGSRSGEDNNADHDEDDWICIAERKIAAAHLVEKKKHADSNDDSGPHQPANRTSAARASNTVTHQESLLRPTVQPLSHHQNSRANQNCRPKKLSNTVPRTPTQSSD